MNEAEWLDLLTRPLSEDELKAYMGELNGEAFQQMLQDYHAQMALNATRELVLGFLKQKCPAESVLAAVCHVWLDTMVKLAPSFGGDTLKVWRQMPDMLAQVTLQQAVVALTERQDDLVHEETPELEDMFQVWRQWLRSDLSESALDAAALQEMTHSLHQIARQFVDKLEAEPELKLAPTAFFEIWCRVMLQLYIFVQENERPEFYYLLEQNWKIFADTLPLLIDMMRALQGMEHLLLPENREGLLQVLSQPDVAQYLTPYFEDSP